MAIIMNKEQTMAFADWSLEESEEAGYQAIYTPRKLILEDITRTVDTRGCVSIGRKYKGKTIHIIVTEESGHVCFWR